MWALRDAVGALKYYRDVPTASAFYGKIADEISRGRMDHDLITAATIGRDRTDAA